MQENTNKRTGEWVRESETNDSNRQLATLRAFVHRLAVHIASLSHLITGRIRSKLIFSTAKLTFISSFSFLILHLTLFIAFSLPFPPLFSATNRPL
jgi:hypothetical protein